MVQRSAKPFIQRMLPSGFLVPLDDYLIRRLNVQDFHIQVNLPFQIQEYAVCICKHLSGAKICCNRQLLQMIFRFPADIHEFSDQLGRQIVNAIISNILQNIHDNRFSGARHSRHNHYMHPNLFLHLSHSSLSAFFLRRLQRTATETIMAFPNRLRKPVPVPADSRFFPKRSA